MSVEPRPNEVFIFTDGASSPHKAERPGGWGAVMLFNEHVKELAGAKADTTNNEMELMAILMAMRAVKVRNKHLVSIVSDSEYSINAITIWHKGWVKKGWRSSKGKPIKNRELIELCVAEAATFKGIRFLWVKGHSGNKWNDRADELAVSAKNRYRTFVLEAAQTDSGVIDFRRRRQME